MPSVLGVVLTAKARMCGRYVCGSINLRTVEPLALAPWPAGAETPQSNRPSLASNRCLVPRLPPMRGVSSDS